MRLRARLIIFDLDGTLLDAYETIRANLNRALRDLNQKPVDLKTVQAAVGMGPRQLLAHFVSAQNLPDALKFFQMHYEKNLFRGTRVYPGVRRTLFQLRARGYRLALASNKPSIYTGPLLRHFHLETYFDAVLCGDQVVLPKPNPMMLREIFRRLRCPASKAVYVGDMTIDGLTGRRAGVRTLCVLTGGYRRSQLLKEHPLKVMKDVRALLRLMDERAQA